MWLWRLLGFLSMAESATAVFVLDEWKEFPYDIVRHLLTFGPTYLIYYSFHRARRYAARMSQNAAAGQQTAGDSPPPVVYLRSFVVDEEMGSTPGIQPETEEEVLALIFGRVGPFVALGRPQEELPTLGAARMYMESGWEQAVTDLMSGARLVVLRAGETEGLLWELGRATQVLSPERLLIVVPDGRKSYEAFRERAQPFFPRPLPEYPVRKPSRANLKGLICFEPGWAPRFLTFKWALLRGHMTNPLPYALQWVLKPVYERLGIPWRPPPINWGRLLILIFFALALLQGLYQLARRFSF